MQTDLDLLRQLVNRKVRLFFSDGEIVDAILLDVDVAEHDDLTYDRLTVVRPGKSTAMPDPANALYVAQLADLLGWELPEVGK